MRWAERAYPARLSGSVERVLRVPLEKPAGVNVWDVRTDAAGWLGVALLGIGLALHGWSNVVLAGHDASRDGRRRSPRQGPFRFVRNPIYLAGIILLTGVGLLYGPWHPNDLVCPASCSCTFIWRSFRVEGNCASQVIWRELRRVLSTRAAVVAGIGGRASDFRGRVSRVAYTSLEWRRD
jgi:hypothetical protein